MEGRRIAGQLVGALAAWFEAESCGESHRLKGLGTSELSFGLETNLHSCLKDTRTSHAVDIANAASQGGGDLA
jgi:hypothetical protein